MASAHPVKTVYIRADSNARDGRADVAPVPIEDANGFPAWFGEVSGEEVVIDALVADIIASDTDADEWLSWHGYARTVGDD